MEVVRGREGRERSSGGLRRDLRVIVRVSEVVVEEVLEEGLDMGLGILGRMFWEGVLVDGLDEGLSGPWGEGGVRGSKGTYGWSVGGEGSGILDVVGGDLDGAGVQGREEGPGKGEFRHRGGVEEEGDGVRFGSGWLVLVIRFRDPVL